MGVTEDLKFEEESARSLGAKRLSWSPTFSNLR